MNNIKMIVNKDPKGCSRMTKICKSTMAGHFLPVLFLTLAVSGCAFQGADMRDTARDEQSLVKSNNNATLALLDSANLQTQKGNLEGAAAVIERALRIEPRNPGLWHKLAKIRFEQGQYKMAMSLAAKSNSFAGSDSDLIARNKLLIQDARSR